MNFHHIISVFFLFLLLRYVEARQSLMGPDTLGLRRKPQKSKLALFNVVATSLL